MYDMDKKYNYVITGIMHKGNSRLQTHRFRKLILDYVAIILLLNARWFFFALSSNTIIYLVKYGFFAFVIIQFVRKNKFTKEFIWLGLLMLIILFTTLIHGDSPYLVVQRYVPILAMYILLYNNLKRVDEFLYNTYSCLEIVIYINLACILIYPGGMNSEGYIANWFIGQKQDFAMAFIPALVIGALYVGKGISRKRYICLLVAMLFQAITHLSLGLVISIIAFVLCVLILRIKKTTKSVFLLLINILVQIVVYLLISHMEWFSRITGILGGISAGSFSKLETLVIRTLLWKDALYIFQSSPIFGAGMISEVRNHLFINTLNYYPNFHGLLFDLLATCGILGVGYYLHLNISILKKNKTIHCRKQYILCAGVFAINIFFLTEALYSPLLFLILFLCIYIKKIEVS